MVTDWSVKMEKETAEATADAAVQKTIAANATAAKSLAEKETAEAEADAANRTTMYVTIPFLAWCPCLSSSTHHAACTEKVGVDLIKLCGY